MKIVEFFETNESPLWQLASKLPAFLDEPEIDLKQIEEWIERKYPDAELLLILYQADGPTGFIALDENAKILNQP